MSNTISVIECSIQIDNGLYLDGDLYLPESENKLPVIIMRTPYGKHNINAVFDPIQITRLGFALLVQNVRGRYESNGIFSPFKNEKADGDATINWLIEQDWSNKNIYALGVSYEGFTAILLGMSKYTKAIAPIMSSSNIYRDWFFENGCIKQGFVQSWSHSFAFTDNGELLSANVIDDVQRLASNIKSLYYGHMAEFPISKCLDYYKSWIDYEDSIYWDDISNVTTGDNQAAIYYVSGWYDIFCDGTIKQFNEELKKGTHPLKLVIGPWSHVELFGSVVGDVDFGVYSFEKYSSMDIINWFIQIEKGQISQSKICLYIMGKNKWFRCDTIPEASYKSYYFCKTETSRILLPVYCDCYMDKDSFFFDATNPVPTCGGRCIDAIPEGFGGPKIQNSIEERTDVLSYTSVPIEDEITIIGEVFVSLSCVSSLEKMDYTVKLCDVDEYNNSINLLDSCLRIDNAADEKSSYELCIGTIGHCFMPGHRIRCEISFSNFPRLNIQDWLLDKRGENTIFLDGITAIKMPVVNIN